MRKKKDYSIWGQHWDRVVNYICRRPHRLPFAGMGSALKTRRSWLPAVTSHLLALALALAGVQAPTTYLFYFSSSTFRALSSSYIVFIIHSSRITNYLFRAVNLKIMRTSQHYTKLTIFLSKGNSKLKSYSAFYFSSFISSVSIPIISSSLCSLSPSPSIISVYKLSSSQLPLLFVLSRYTHSGLENLKVIRNCILMQYGTQAS